MRVLYFFVSHAAEGFQSFNIHIMEFLKSANKIKGVKVIPAFPVVTSKKALEPELRLFHAIKYKIPRPIKDILGILYNFIYFYRSIHIIKKVNPDVILYLNNHNNFYNALIQKFFNIPLVMEVNTPHTLERKKYNQLYFYSLSLWIEIWTWKVANKIYTVSEHQKKIITKHGIQENKIVAIHNGVNLDVFKPIKSKSDENLNHIEIIYVGSFRKYHGLSKIIDTFYTLSKHHPTIHITIIGTGETFKQIKELVNSLNLSHFISLPGLVPYELIPSFLSKSDIAFISDFTEYGSPIKVFEYMATKNAVLVPDRQSILEILEDGKDALFFEVGNMDDFQNKLERLITNKKLRETLSENAYNKVINNYTWDHNAKKVIELLEEAIKDYKKV